MKMDGGKECSCGSGSVPCCGGQGADLEPKTQFEGSKPTGKSIKSPEDPYQQVTKFGTK